MLLLPLIYGAFFMVQFGVLFLLNQPQLYYIVNGITELKENINKQLAANGITYFSLDTKKAPQLIGNTQLIEIDQKRNENQTTSLKCLTCNEVKDNQSKYYLYFAISLVLIAIFIFLIFLYKKKLSSYYYGFKFWLLKFKKRGGLYGLIIKPAYLRFFNAKSIVQRSFKIKHEDISTFSTLNELARDQFLNCMWHDYLVKMMDNNPLILSIGLFDDVEIVYKCELRADESYLSEQTFKKLKQKNNSLVLEKVECPRINSSPKKFKILGSVAIENLVIDLDQPLANQKINVVESKGKDECVIGKDILNQITSLKKNQSNIKEFLCLMSMRNRNDINNKFIMDKLSIFD
jgi:hypothetical protein